MLHYNANTIQEEAYPVRFKLDTTLSKLNGLFFSVLRWNEFAISAL